MVSPDFVSGFLAGEASFTVRTRVRNGNPRISPMLSVIVHEKDVETLKAIKEFFDDVGHIYDYEDDCKTYTVRNQKELGVVVEKLKHCDSWYVTEKYNQYETWCKMVELYTEEYHTPRRNMVEMAKLAKNELNVGLGKTEESWDEFIEQLS